MKYIIAAGLLQIIISLLLLCLNNRKEKSDYLLAAFLGAIGWHLLTKFFIFTSVENPSVIFRMHTFVQLSYGPLLYMYAKKKCNELFIPARLWFLFIPLIMSVTLYGCVVAAFITYPEKADLLLQLYNSLVFLPIVGAHIIFGALTLKKIKQTKIIEQQLLRNLSFLVILVGFADILLIIVSTSFPGYTLLVRSVLYTLLGLVPVLVIRYKYVAMPSEWQPDMKMLAFEGSDYAINTKFETQGTMLMPELKNTGIHRKLLLNNVQHQEIYRIIESFVKDKKLYADEDLSLEKLSALSGFSRHYISETLNVFAKKSFYQYINGYRVEEVIRLLGEENHENTSLLTVAYRSGFKNKASFNQHFKKVTGSTPSNYLKIKK
ncbi:hypothetical protein AY601_2825 [Pedobacter cryoconitis]|uniref:HTH araC/xylS-type domain-containing protein n=1 Tax=Pedobacter cryoconitis TaxID=188932 RepID=A0A127VEG9_9SPHI|nr:AraC family transcriptional regulator [Pedobacter cryoconitis]AMP99705.1 hypothetical protein AY601_2825 [Pedobacter cryoconitis]